MINRPEVEGYFRYPDLTDHCVYLINTIHDTLSEDMPDKKLSNMLMFLHQNKGIFPKRRREQFSELTDAEIQRMQETYRKVYDIEI